MIADYEGILAELGSYNKSLLERPRLTVISKVDVLVEKDEDRNDSEALLGFHAYLKLRNEPYLEISSAFRVGIEKLLHTLLHMLEQNKSNDST